MGFIVEKPQSLLRWPVLALACLMLLGSYYCADVPSALKQQIDDYFHDPSYFETYFSLLYTIYAVPNVILPFFGGYFVDRFGVQICLLIFTTLITLGQLIFSIGISVRSWYVLFLGRFVFGLGGECLIVANSALIADWFRGRELAFAFGVNLAIARLGSVVNNLVSPALVRSAGVGFACWFGVIICAMSVGCVLLTMPIDAYMAKKYSHKLLPQEDDNDSSHYADFNSKANANEIVGGETSSGNNSPPLFSHQNSTFGDDSNTEVTAVAPQVQFRDVFKLKRILWVLSISCFSIYGCVHPFNNILASLLLERDYFQVPPSNCQLTDPHACQSSDNIPNSYCPSSRWYQPPLPSDITVNSVYYPNSIPESAIDCTSSVWKGPSGCTQEYCDRLTNGEARTSVIMSIPFIISGAVSPFLGLAIDRFGYRAVIATISPCGLIIVHSMLGFSKVSPVGPLVGQGLAYTGFAAVLWPAVPLVVEERLTGLAFGVITSILNTGSAVLPLLVAAIYNDSGSYIPNVEVLFICLASIGFLAGLYLNYYDYNHHSILNRGFQTEEVVAALIEKSKSFDSNQSPVHSAVASTQSSMYSPSPVTETSKIRSLSRTYSNDKQTIRSKSREAHLTFTAYEEMERAGVYDKEEAVKTLLD